MAWLKAGILTVSFLGELDVERRYDGRTRSEKLQMVTSSSSKRCFPIEAGTLGCLEYFDLRSTPGWTPTLDTFGSFDGVKDVCEDAANAAILDSEGASHVQEQTTLCPAGYCFSLDIDLYLGQARRQLTLLMTSIWSDVGCTLQLQHMEDCRCMLSGE